MADAGVTKLRYETEVATPFTCADGTGIEKGACLGLSDPSTVLAATDEAMCGGIAAEEKIASNGITKISVYRGGRFKGTASGSITVGNALAFAGDNYVKVADATCSGSRSIGIALETASAGETFEFELRPGANVAGGVQ